VLQLSVHRNRTPAEHLAIGRALAPLRRQGVLVLASGNVTHNLRHAMTSDGTLPDWARSFDADIARALEQRDSSHLTRALDTDSGRLSHPTPDHYLPLLYAAGAASKDDGVSFPISGFDLGSISMRTVRFG
jgi:4,5-DOPA dioxygenase extradiol